MYGLAMGNCEKPPFKFMDRRIDVEIRSMSERPHAYANADGRPGEPVDGYAHAYDNAHAYRYAHAHTYGYTHAHAYEHAHTHHNTNAYDNADGRPRQSVDAYAYACTQRAVGVCGRHRLHQRARRPRIADWIHSFQS